MGSHKSLVAVEIIDNILHKCKFVKCEEMFPLGEELAGHEKICKHRIVRCPDAKCDKKFSLSDALGHIGKNTCNSRGEVGVVDDFTATVQDFGCDDIDILEHELSWDTNWYTYRDTLLALCVVKSRCYYHFYIVMFECEEVCSGHTVELEVYKSGAPQVARHSCKFRGNPVSIDAPKWDFEQFGLSVHHKVLEKMVLEDDGFLHLLVRIFL